MNAFYHAEKEFNRMGLEGGVSFDVYPAMMVIQPKVSSSGVSMMHFPQCARVTCIAPSDKMLLEYDRELTRLDLEFCHETLVSQSDLIRVCGDGRGVREVLPRGDYVGFYIKRCRGWVCAHCERVRGSLILAAHPLYTLLMVRCVRAISIERHSTA
jgi:hypothetical protein